MTIEGILKFNLDEPKGAAVFELMSKARKYHDVLFDLDQYLRGELKYKELPEEVDAALQECRDKLHRLMSDYEIGFLE